MWAAYFHYVLEHMPRAVASPFDERHPLYALVEIEGTDQAADDRDRLEDALGAALQCGVIADAVVAHVRARGARAFGRFATASATSRRRSSR